MLILFAPGVWEWNKRTREGCGKTGGTWQGEPRTTQADVRADVHSSLPDSQERLCNRQIHGCADIYGYGETPRLTSLHQGQVDARREHTQVRPGAIITLDTGTSSGLAVADSEKVAALTDMFTYSNVSVNVCTGLLVAGATAFVSDAGRFPGPVL